jgi:shikimate dehydrogenase
VALLVNATSLGMVGQPPLEVDLTPLPEHAVVYDVVYAPLETELLQAAKARGLETVDGLEMLIGQAALAFELLFGAEPPRDRDAELRALLAA